MKYSDVPVGQSNLALRQNERQTSPLTKVQLCEYKTQTLEVPVGQSNLADKMKDRVLHKRVSQSRIVTKSEKFWGATRQSKLVYLMAGRNKRLQSLVFLLTQLHFGQWSSLPFSMSSLIIQWPVRIFCFYLLHMIVELAYWPIAVV